MYDLLPTVMALFEYQRNLIQGKEKDRTVVNMEEEKLRAELDMKQADVLLMLTTNWLAVGRISGR